MINRDYIMRIHPSKPMYACVYICAYTNTIFIHTLQGESMALRSPCGCEAAHPIVLVPALPGSAQVRLRKVFHLRLQPSSKVESWKPRSVEGSVVEVLPCVSYGQSIL